MSVIAIRWDEQSDCRCGMAAVCRQNGAAMSQRCVERWDDCLHMHAACLI